MVVSNPIGSLCATLEGAHRQFNPIQFNRLSSRAGRKFIVKISKKKGIASAITAIAVSASLFAIAGTASATDDPPVEVDFQPITGYADFCGTVNDTDPNLTGYTGYSLYVVDDSTEGSIRTLIVAVSADDNTIVYDAEVEYSFTFDNTPCVVVDDPPVVLDDPTVSITCLAVTITNPNDSSLFATIIEPDGFWDGVEIAGGTSLVLPFPEFNVSELYVYVGSTDYYAEANVQYPADCGVTDPPPVVDPPVKEEGPAFSGTPPVVKKAAPSNG